MTESGFADGVYEARQLEKKLLEYAPYAGDMQIVRTMDLEPREYMDLSYHDMLNLYERNRKIISTASLGILTARAEETPSAAPVKTGEVESKLREMTTETLQKADAVGHEPIALQMESSPEKAPAEARIQTTIEFEEQPAPEAAMEKIELEGEEKATPRTEARTREDGEAGKTAAPVMEKTPERPVPKTAPAPPGLDSEAGFRATAVPTERRVIMAMVPPALRENPDQAASRRYAQIKEQIVATLGESADEATIKKKMLELTKQLFKEKITSRREEIKLQITALKNMLIGAGSNAAAGAKKKGDDPTNARLFQSILEAQKAELAQIKDSIADSYKKQVTEVRNKFYDEIATTEDPTHRKRIFDNFTFSVTMLAEQLPAVLKKYQDFTCKKHTAEMDKLVNALAENEKGTRKAAEDRLASIRNGYDPEFAPLREMIIRDIDNLVEKTGTDILKKDGEKQAPGEAKAQEIVAAINETDEGTLLYYLHNKDGEYYKKYETKQLAKAETILRAKQLMARERGLNDSMVKRFFGRTEG